MSGSYSRNKGKRVEYEIRDLFREAGFVAHRVPSSGSAQGFKGDLHIVSPSGFTYKVEVKARKTEFDTLYKLMPKLTTNHIFTVAGQLVTISTGIAPLFEMDITYRPMLLTTREEAILRKIQAYGKGCDIVVVKNDRHYPIYLRFSNA